MGLDITAISEMEVIKAPEGIELYSDEYYDWEESVGGNIWNVWNSEHFNPQNQGLPEDGDLVQAKGDVFGFRAGSYSGYGQWRDDLARAAGNKEGAQGVWNTIDDEGFKNKPFQELINFYDNDGIIGPVASQKLYEDFVNYESKIDEVIDWWYLKMNPEKEYNTEDVQWFKSLYNDWKHAFDIARKNGMVIFH